MLAQHIDGVLAEARGGAGGGRRERRLRTQVPVREEGATRTVLRMRAKLARFEDRFQAAIDALQARDPLVPGRGAEERIDLRRERRVESASFPAGLLDRRAKCRPELRLEGPESDRASIAASVDAVARPASAQHVLAALLRRLPSGERADVRNQELHGAFAHR